MTTPVRYPNGVSDHAAGNSGIGLTYPTLDPARYVRYWNDFIGYTAGDWTVTAVGAGSAVATTTTTGLHGGAITLTGDTADNDGVQIQSVQECFTPASGKRFWLRARFKLSDATDQDALLGVAITDTSLCASLPTDGIYFLKADDATTLIASIRKNGTSSSITMGAVAADTFVTAELVYDGKTTWKAYLNGVQVGTEITSVTNMPDDEILAVSIASLNGAGASKVLTVDWIEVLSDR